MSSFALVIRRVLPLAEISFQGNVSNGKIHSDLFTFYTKCTGFILKCTGRYIQVGTGNTGCLNLNYTVDKIRCKIKCISFERNS